MPRKNQARAANQELPDIKDGVSVCRVGVSRGGSQFEVWDGERTWLAELPKRFRNTIWVRRGKFALFITLFHSLAQLGVGSYVLVDMGQDPPQGSATRGNIIFVLQKDHVAELKQRNSW